VKLPNRLVRFLTSMILSMSV